jgi:hypothetical protein
MLISNGFRVVRAPLNPQLSPRSQLAPVRRCRGVRGPKRQGSDPSCRAVCTSIRREVLVILAPESVLSCGNCIHLSSKSFYCVDQVCKWGLPPLHARFTRGLLIHSALFSRAQTCSNYPYGGVVWVLAPGQSRLVCRSTIGACRHWGESTVMSPRMSPL